MVESILRQAVRKQVQELDLSNKDLSSIPPQVFELKRLLNLNLSCNSIVSIDKEISNLSYLKELNLSFNLIEELPIEITELSNLEKVLLNGNPIYNKIGGDFSVKWKEELKNFIFHGKNLKKEDPVLISSANHNQKKINSIKNPESGKLRKALDGVFQQNNDFNNSNTPNITNTMNYTNSSNQLKPLTKKLDINSLHNTGKINILIKKQSVQLNNENDSLGLGGNKELKEIKDNSSKENEKLLLMNKKMNGHINFLKQKIKEIQEKHLIETEGNTKKIELLESKIYYMTNELEDLKNELLKEKENNANLHINNNNIVVNNQVNQQNSNQANSITQNKAKIGRRTDWLSENKQQSNNLVQQEPIKISKEEENNIQKEQHEIKRLKSKIQSLEEKLSETSIPIFSSSNIREISLEEVKIEQEIGKGGFAIINKGQYQYLPVAVKIIFDPKITEDLLDEFNNEIKMLSILRHPNIVQIIAISKKPKLAILTEHVDKGSLYNCLHIDK